MHAPTSLGVLQGRAASRATAQLVTLSWWVTHPQVPITFRGTHLPSQQSSFTSHLPRKLRTKCLGLCSEAHQPALWLFPSPVLESDGTGIFQGDMVLTDLETEKASNFCLWLERPPVSAAKV